MNEKLYQSSQEKEEKIEEIESSLLEKDQEIQEN